MTAQARPAATRNLLPASLVLLASVVWWLLHIDWAAARGWLRTFLVFYGTWMMDP